LSSAERVRLRYLVHDCITSPLRGHVCNLSAN
jgi:hypothetical protein